MVVALVGHDDAPLAAVDGAEVHHAGVLHRPDHHVGGVVGQVLLEVGAAALVGAVLAPHGVEEGHLGECGRTAEEVGHLAGLAGSEGQTVFAQVLAEALVVVGSDGNGGGTLVSNGHEHPRGLQ